MDTTNASGVCCLSRKTAARASSLILRAMAGWAVFWVVRFCVAAAPFPSTSGLTVELATECLPTPLVIHGDPFKRAITAIGIRGEFPEGGEGKGSITFDESPYRFDEFGEATKLAGGKAKPTPVVFRPVSPAPEEAANRPFLDL